MKADFKRRFKLWFEENGLMALLALAVAAMIYGTIAPLVTHTLTLSLPVEVERSKDMAIESVSLEKIRVVFTGTEKEIDEIRNDGDLKILVRYPGASDGKETSRKIKLKGRRARVVGSQGRRVKISTSFDAKEITVNASHSGTVEFPIAEPQLVGKPYRGRAMVEYTPKRANVSGARLQLDRLANSGANLEVEPLNVDGRVQGFTRTVAILPLAEAWNPKVQPGEVQVTVTIVPDNIRRVFDDIPLQISYNPAVERMPDFQVSTQQVAVTVEGWVDLIANLDESRIRAYAEAPAKLNGTNTAKIKVWIPPEMETSNVEVNPEIVRFYSIDSAIGPRKGAVPGPNAAAPSEDRQTEVEQ